MTGVAVSVAFRNRLIGVLLCLFVVSGNAALVDDRPAVMSDRAIVSLLLDITHAGDSGRLVAAGDRGHILYSDDGGQHWQQARVPTSLMLTAISFPSADIGYAVGHDAVILKTVDGGRRWEKVYEDPKEGIPLLDVLFFSNSAGMAAGAYGMLLETRDGGINWQRIADRISNPDEMHFNAIHQDQNNNLFLAGEAGILYRSANQGKSWQTLKSPYKGSWFGLNSTMDGQLQAFGLRGSVYQSADAGLHWREVNIGSNKTLFGAANDKQGATVLVGSAGALISQNGKQWKSSEYVSRAALNAAIFNHEGQLVAVGEGGIHQLQLPDRDVASQ